MSLNVIIIGLGGKQHSLTLPHVEWWRRLDHSTIEVKTYGNMPCVTKHVLHAEWKWR